MLVFDSKAQGTIEYLIILAVVIVISLAVVFLVTQNNDGQVTNISSASNALNNSSRAISISDSVMDVEGDGLITLQNNSGERLTITKISVGEKDLNYSSTMPQGDKKTFSLNDLNAYCTCAGASGTKRECSFSVYFQSEAGLAKRFDYTVLVECVGDAQPIDPPIQPTPPGYFARKAGGTSNDIGEAIIVDSSGNSYVTGVFWQTVFFGSNIHLDANTTTDDAFVAKMDSSGNWLWTQKATGANLTDSTGYSIDIDSSGNIFITGTFFGTVFFGSTRLDSNDLTTNAFVAKMDSSGNWLWAKKVSGVTDEHGESISVDESGNSYVSGYYSGTAFFGSNIRLDSNSGTDDVFITKLDSSGNFLWAKSAGGSVNDYSYAISADSSGNSYVSGHFSGTAMFGTNKLDSNSGSDDVFIAKLDTDGNFLWVTKVNGQTSDYTYGSIIDSGGNVYVAGWFSGGSVMFGSTKLDANAGTDIFVTKLDNSGNFLWAKSAGGANNDSAYSISVDSSGNSYITGTFYTTTMFESTRLDASGGSDGFVAKLSSDGNTWLWAKDAGGGASDNVYGLGIGVDASGNSYTTGYFLGSAMFGSVPLDSNSASGDIFVWKITADGTT